MLTHHSHLWHKYKTKCGRRAEDDEDGDDDEGSILLVAQNERQAGPNHAHNNHIVYLLINWAKVIAYNMNRLCLVL